MIDTGDVANQAELANQLGLTRARITQVFRLLLLAPDIQEEVLLCEVEGGREPVTERKLRKVVQEVG